MHPSDLDGSILLAKNRTDHPGPSWEEILTEFTYVFTPLSLHQFIWWMTEVSESSDFEVRTFRGGQRGPKLEIKCATEKDNNNTN